MSKFLLKVLGVLVVAVFLYFPLDGRGEEVLKPYEGISAEELMKIKYRIKYTKFAKDYQSTGDFYLTDKRGFRRHRRFLRKRITLNRPADGLDYKDMVVITRPANIKGLAVLTWCYLDPKREREQWLWLPSQRKVRRTSPSRPDDAFLGTDFTVEELTSRKWEDETYKILREEKFAGYESKLTGETYYSGLDCYVVEARPKKKDWYYTRRIVWLDKKTGAGIFDEIYDQLSRKSRIIFRKYDFLPEGPAQALLECINLRTGHWTVVKMSEIKFNIGLKESAFTYKALERTKW
ncbi:MAG: outer membrane lipoprotein-sorting protein [Candidatus Omnitrophica bacterium]|nr:outer membrane lipoprotein-sorting protein [Candidatus Omnitrophota bacterium]